MNMLGYMRFGHSGKKDMSGDLNLGPKYRQNLGKQAWSSLSKCQNIKYKGLKFRNNHFFPVFEIDDA